MNIGAENKLPQASVTSKTDPFNYPTMNRADLMSLSTINGMKDNQKTTTSKFVTGRSNSNNLHTKDIEGKLNHHFDSNFSRCRPKTTWIKSFR